VLLATVAALAIGIAWRPLTAAASAHTGPAAGPLPPITAAADWQDSPPVSPPWRPHYAGAGSERHQWFARAGRTVGVYMALYSQQGQGRELVVSENRLVAADDPLWKKLGEGRKSMGWDNGDITARTAEISGGGLRLSARTWYWVGGRYTASDAWAKAWLARAKLLRQPDHSALIVIYAVQPEGSAVDATVLDDFARDMGIAIMQALRQATAAGA
jgi:EpsI family protein